MAESQAFLFHDPIRSTAAPWKAVFRAHGKWVDWRFWTDDEARGVLTSAGYTVVNGQPPEAEGCTHG